MKIFSISLLLLISIFSFSQDNFKFALYGGPDFSLLESPADSITVESLVTPFFGLEFLYPMSGNNHIRFGASYFLKGSKNNRNGIKYKNTFASVYANYHLGLSDNVFLTFGPQYSFLLNAYTLNGSVKEDMSDYQSYMSINGGIDIQLQSHLNLGVIYEYPINNNKLSAWPSIKVKASIIIDNDLFKVKEKKSKKTYSENKLKELKRTALLVSLRGYKRQLDALRKVGDTTRFKLVEQKRDNLNRSIMDAFAKEFDFCPVYFFYNYDTRKIKDREFNNVFLAYDLKIDSTIQFNLDTFLIGELGYTVTDTSVTTNHSVVYKNGFNMADGYAESETIESDISHYGFYIRNQDFSFIGKPFPSFISGYVLFVRRSNEGVIRRLNNSLKGIKGGYNAYPDEKGVYPTKDGINIKL